MSGIRGLAATLAIVICSAGTPARAQDPGGGDEGPGTASSSVVVDEEQAELERMQREAETQGEPDPSESVVERDRERDDAPPEGSLHHGEQLGLRAGVALPYIFAIKYGDGPKCDEDGGETFCRRLGAFLLDLEIGFGVSEGVELSILGRIGLTDDDAAEARPVAFGVGARAYGAPHEMFKLYFGGRVMMDVTSSDTPDWKTIDFGVRGELGLQIDFARYVGMYIQLGETISVLRGWYFKTDLGAGLQLRFP